MFEGNKRIDGSRSNTALIKSGHASPAEEWLLDPRFLSDAKLSSVFKDGALFTYQYGGPGMDEVTIPKGRMVGVSTPVKDYVTKKFKTVMTLPGMALNHNSVGMVPYNIAKDLLQQDRFGGNAIGIITTDYIIMPYVPSISPTTPADTTYAAGRDALILEEQALSVNNRMPWGCILGKLEVGDYVKSTPSGRLTKWLKGTDGAEDIVGQALGCDLNAEPWGWLKWMLWDDSALAQDDKYINRSGVSNLPTDNGYPYDPQYSLGNTIFQDVHSQALTDPTGIAGLQDGSGNFIGYGKNDTQYEGMELAVAPGSVTAGTLMVINAKDYAGGNLTNLKEGVVLKYGDDAATATVIVATEYTVNYKTGAITLTLGAAMAGKKIFGNYQAYHFGTSSYLDFKGVAGAFFILLKK